MNAFGMPPVRATTASIPAAIHSARFTRLLLLRGFRK
jgi:hypothetical protein